MKYKNEALPKGWELTSIGEIFKLRGGGTPDKKIPQYWEGDIPWASVKDIKNDYQHTTIDKITPEGLDNSSATLALENELILITRISPGVSSIVKKQMAINQDLKVVTCPEGMPPEFAHYLFKTLQKQIISLSSGTTVLGIRLTELNNISFPLPPLNEQKRIVAKIEELFSELDAGEQSLRDARQKLTLYRQSLLKQAFEGKLTEQWRANNPDKLEDPKTLLARIQQERESRHQQQLQTWEQAVEEWEEHGKEGKKPIKPKKIDVAVKVSNPNSPEHWVTVHFKHIGDWTGGGTPSKSNKEFWTKGTIPWVSPKDMKANEIVSTIDQITEDAITNSSAKLVPPHSVLFVVRSGILRRVLPIAYTEIALTLNQDLQSVTPIYAMVKYVYLYATSCERNIREECAKDGTTVESVDVSKLKEFPIPICSLPEQQEIVRLLDEQFTAIEQNEKEITHSLTQSQALRQSILKKAFEGKLT